MNKSHEAVFNTFKAPDPHSFGVMKMIEEVYPSFKRKILHGNELMQRIVMSGYNCMSILEYPICGKCETLAAYSGEKWKDNKRVPICTCFKCGASTVAPITFRQWMADELRHKAPPEFMDAVDSAVDIIAERMMQNAIQYLQRVVGSQQAQNNAQILGADGQPMQSEQDSVKIWHGRGISKDDGEVEVD